MKKIIFAFLVLSFVACTSTNNVNTEGYTALTSGAELSNYVGKKVYFKVKTCEFAMQHMLRASLNGPKSYICIDRVNDKGEVIDQMLAYTDLEVEKEGIFTVFGTLSSQSGVGKGGGTHTEYYLELDKVSTMIE